MRICGLYTTPVARAAETLRTGLPLTSRLSSLSSGDFTLPDAKDLRVTGSMTIGHSAGNLDTRGNISVSCAVPGRRMGVALVP